MAGLYYLHKNILQVLKQALKMIFYVLIVCFYLSIVEEQSGMFLSIITLL